MRPYLRAANATWNGVDLSDVKEMDFPPEIWGNYRLQKDDILLAEASGSPNEVGKPFMWKEQIAECGFQNTLIRVRLFDLAPDFVHIHFLADATTGRFGTVAKGVNIQHLGANRLSRFAIALPPLAEQRRIVAEVERRLSVVAALEREVEAAMTRAARLRQSILKRAFEGRLVVQDPADEPASELLERIKVLRRKLQKGQERRKTRQRQQRVEQEEHRMDIGAPSELRELLRQLQQQTGGPIPVDQLFEVSKLEIEDFHILLREELRSGRIREHRDGYRAFLEIADENQEPMD